MLYFAIKYKIVILIMEDSINNGSGKDTASEGIIDLSSCSENSSSSNSEYINSNLARAVISSMEKDIAFLRQENEELKQEVCVYI